ncbi:hypothetical protein Poly30_35190 [Planctomycetes bacterium Poly30]|uniref:Carboxypeptidase regulatory-like domain-containing protein n=1 Tax=Saltatorellus ferox TaxID=2528018 RepID=A0A518EV60_9BACT|nr:hypothetical protein Poly30_35190 [Planctomycetes bacterium Poly30]
MESCLPGHGGSTIANATSDGDGHYAFRPALAGTYKILAGSSPTIIGDLSDSSVEPHLGGAEVLDLILREGDQIAGLDLHLTAASTVTGVVRDASSDPVGAARVECWATVTDRESFRATSFITVPHTR